MTKKEVLSLAKSKYSRKTSEERKQEIKELSEKAFAEIERYSTSPESLLEYAEFLSRFHSYSLNNIALIQNQFEGAVAVASYKDWNDKGYSVLKGEKGIEIFSYTPVTLFKDADGNTKRLSEATKEEKQLIKEGKITTRKISHYSKGHVFDISQTNAPIEDLPKIFPNKQFNFKIEEGNNAAHLLKGIEAVAKDLDIEIKDMRMSSLGYTELGTAKGAFIQNTIDPSKKEIVLNSRNTPTQNLATAIHELAHAKMHYKGSDMEHSNTATLEFQAELTSYIVCKHYGMDTSEKAIPYIARWTNNGEKLEDKQKAIEGVHKTAAEFIETMDLVISHEKELDQSLKPEPIDYYNELLVIPNKNLFPTDEEELIYCDLTGKAIAQDEEYYHLENGVILSEEGKKLVFTDKEWERIINDENNYRATCFYDVDQKDMTTKEPERKIDQDIYYYYDGQSEPLKLGTASDIIAAAQNKDSIGHFSCNHDMIRDLTLAKNEDKSDFNKQMRKHNILKNPGIKDFEKINDRLGLNPKQNLKNLQLDTDITKKALRLSRNIER